MSVGYDPSYFSRLFAVEDRHFWFRARNRILARQASIAAAEFGSGCRVLEVGCGDGNVLRFLERACRASIVVGMDYFGEALAYARRRVSCPLVRGDLAQPPFRQTFHLVGIFDVLEHMPDDLGVLLDLRRMLTDGGKVLLTVPAHPSLWSAFDEASGHCRRYESEQLRARLMEAGFTIEYLTPYMASLFPLARLRRTGRAAKRDLEHAIERDLRVIPIVNELLLALLTGEAWWIGRGGRLPLGTSLLAVARKT